ncbi:adenosylcobyric acid synthase (glutamine-hydrolysing) [Sulfobacillus thermosulfidooxidans DSM 9293]|uniref:Cobyric acid synthase n=1 Tax=Sulfobacillus thermosulfidooxidans (strain DSM 9293 / VKM B-1269 / AT-1) TaxID=929705 RepID=A0A1W1W6E9_SULTA|nr:cobyric acid synthase [Sulfobacillus thermosulfidooxidans]SMC01845.1 adenosylcobyric acid synthase (glutamine-hydrolysing) [Sulfobacillus thermosulfidooxidans DSM 9293]
MTARALSILGTSSHVGKTWIVAGLCRLLVDQGIRVAPFKAQNMSLNAFITSEGHEMSYAQAIQAWSARLSPRVEMNPILLKPETTSRSQLIVRGQVQGPYESRHFRDNRDELFKIVQQAYDELAQQYDVIIIEGAGSPVELNLMHTDLSNIRMAEYADASMILVGDIDRGGIFASLYGTAKLLPAFARHRLKGLIVNKFRGDITLFDDGIRLLEEITAVPVLGVIPYVDLAFPEEDSLGVPEPITPKNQITIWVVRLPYMSNFTDFDPFRFEPDVNLLFSSTPPGSRPDMIIIPGSKNTLADLAWVKESGWADSIKYWASHGTMVAGICGGFQMMGQKVDDPLGIEGMVKGDFGLGLLPIRTVLGPYKVTKQVQGTGLALPWKNQVVSGYEQHMGETTLVKPDDHSFTPLLALDGYTDGLVSSSGRIWGTYLHGIFHNTAFRHTVINLLGGHGVMTENPFDVIINQWKEVMAEHVDLSALLRLVRS